jgi:hypothetical protein
MFRGTEFPRLLTMITLLGVVGMLIVQARNPAHWKWLAQEQAAPNPAAEPPRPAAAKATDVPQGGAVSPGPTDEDPEQRADSTEEFQAVTDGTIGIQPEEMLAYWRLLLWTEHQSLDMLQRRSRGNVFFTELMQFPDKFRGRLLTLDLNVRRVLAYDLDDTPLGKRRLYELWGFTEESKAWLYVAVTAHLPKGMAVGPEVEERVRLTGYFFKLQGYFEAGAKPRAAALRAPLLVGRLSRFAPPTVGQPSPQDDLWTAAVVVGACLVLAAAVGMQLWSGRRAARHEAVRREDAGRTVREWLEQK